MLQRKVWARDADWAAAGGQQAGCRRWLVADRGHFPWVDSREWVEQGTEESGPGSNAALTMKGSSDGVDDVVEWGAMR